MAEAGVAERLQDVRRRGRDPAGWLSDTVRIRAMQDIDHVERGFGSALEPSVWEARLTIARGQAFEVRLHRRLAVPGRHLSLAEVGDAPGLREHWTGWDL